MASGEQVSVYFIKAKDYVGLIKIGHTSNVAKRLETLQTGNNSPLVLMYELKCSSRKAAKTIERQLHEMFSYCRKKGEWFSNSQPLRDLISWLASGRNYTQGVEEAYKATKPYFRKWKRGIEAKAKREMSDTTP